MTNYAQIYGGQKTDHMIQYAENGIDTYFRCIANYMRNDVDTTHKLYACRSRIGIKKVIFSGVVTTVIWDDGVKTQVRAENESFDKEKGLAMAISKRFLGTNESRSNYYDEFKKWISE